MFSTISKSRIFVVLVLTAFLAACGDGSRSSSGAGTAVSEITITLPAGESSTTGIPVGETVQLTAMATLASGSTENVTSTASWTSSNIAIATVSGTGLVTIKAVGTANITASFSVKSASIGVTGSAATVQSMTVSPSSGSTALGLTKQFSATGTFSDGSTHDVSSTVTWTSSPSGILTIDSTGLAHTVAQGAATVTATSGSVTAHTTFTVGPHVITSVVIAPSSPTIPLGKTLQFTATATYSDGATADVTSSTTWSASPSSVLTIDANGLAHSIGKGSFSLIATSGGQNSNLTGAVGDAVATGISINPASASIPKSSTEVFHAIATMSDSTTQDVSSSTSWQSSNTSVANVDTTGTATASSPGTAQISGNYQSFSSGASLTVTNATAVGINVTAGVGSIAKGTTLQLAATANLSDGSSQNVTSSATWSSSATATATVNSSGLVSGVAPGNAVISAQFGGKTGTLNLTITAATLVSVTITPTNPSVSNGGTLQLHATGTFSDGSTQDVTGSLTYSSSNPAVATIDANGVVHGVATGTANITATQGSVSAQLQLTITSAVLQSITVTPLLPTIVAGVTDQLAAVGLYSDGSTQDLTASVNWSSSNSSIASVDLQGLVTGLGAGSATITATSNSVSGNTDLTISPATITNVTISPLTATVAVGQNQAFTATATLSDGSTQDVTASAHWSVSVPGVGQISNNLGLTGTATGLVAGATQVSASVSGVTGTANLTVTAATVVSVSVNPPTVSIALGVPANLTATATYSDGSTADVTASVQWSSSNGSIASVVAGLVTPLTLGSSNVSATLQGQTGSATISVTAATLSSITIPPLSVSLASGLTSQLTATGTFSDGSTHDITASVHWSSSLGAVATISNTGLVLGISPGSTTITASLGSVSQTTTVNITAATLQSITVTAPQNSLALGFSLQLTATGNYSDGSTQNLTAAVQWNSSNGTIGTVSAAGLVNGILSGSFSANATLQGVTGSLNITISPATLTSISISPSGALSVLLGHQLTLTGHFSDGSTQVITTGVHWSITGSLLATINQSGFLLPISVGNITVTATYGTFTTQVSISLI